MSDRVLVREEQIELQFPIKVDGSTVSSITLRRPKVRDIQVVEARGGDEMTKSVNLIASLTMLTPDQILEMDMGTDFIKVKEKVHSFLGISQ